MKNTAILLLATATLLPLSLMAQQPDSVGTSRALDEVSVQSRREQGVSRLAGAENGQQIGQDELFRAACCNLGESFVTNPSVDVNYNDAAVGARQIKLLGLSGQYVQMLTENLPMTTGVAMPYLLSYVPGSWMSSIAVSKGTSSVKQGYESVTGQINVEYLKPDEDPGIVANLYLDGMLKSEANLVANIHLNKNLSTELLGHYEHMFSHQDENGDGWHDHPAVNQLNLQNRWKLVKGRYIMHAGIGLLDEEREGGQLLSAADVPYRVLIDNRRAEAYMKHAYLLDSEHNTNLAFTATLSRHEHDGRYGNTDHPQEPYPMQQYSANQTSFTSQLMLEHDFTPVHSLSAGFNVNYTNLSEVVPIAYGGTSPDLVPGLYAQYTFKPDYRLTVMAGLRADHSDLHSRTFVTPRLHAKWLPTDWLTLRATTGKGYRTSYPMAENHYLLASGRTMSVAPTSGSILPMEEAWNSGLSAAFYIPLGEHTLTVNAEYYYTNFIQQAVVDFDSDPTAIIITDLGTDGRSFSHTAQVDATYAFTDDLEATAAFRLNDVRCTYGGQLLEKPLTSRYKGLLTVSWKPMMAMWHVDLTLQLNGDGRIPAHLQADGTLAPEERFPAYPQLNAQVTREFRHFSLYIGAENITNYRQKDPLINAANPWASTFDPTMIWGPVSGIMLYGGVRMNFWRL
ncbi:MAG: TonB-dependent receptor [Bacteroidales bacterium]|nr:TonB-dependent receptor [Bacteroidales bacterium]